MGNLPNYWQRLATQRVSRRTALKAGAAAGLGTAATIALGGCGGGSKNDTTNTPAPVGTPQYGGKISTAVTTDPGGLDPHYGITNGWIVGQLHGYLYAVNFYDQTAMLEMAESFEQPDNTTYLWKLRPGIKFQNVDPVNGRVVTADDVVYSFTRRRDDGAVMNDKVFLRDYTTGFEATDGLTFKLQTTRPYSPGYDTMGGVSYAIVPHEAVEKWGDLQQHSVGCGAYILDEFVKADHVKMHKNPDFYMAGRPYIENREWQVITDTSTLLQAFEAGQQDIYGSRLDKRKVDELKGIKGIVIRDVPFLSQRSVSYNITKDPFKDPRVGQALDLAVDRQDLIAKMAFGEGKVAGPIPPDFSFWALPQDEVDNFYKVDLAEAKKLLSAAGYQDGFDVDVPTMTIVDMANFGQVVKEQLSKINVRCNLQPKEIGAFLVQTLKGDFSMVFSFSLGATEPDAYLGAWFSKGNNGTNITGYNNPVMDDWIWKERSEFDRNKRKQIVLDAQRAMMNEHSPGFQTYTPKDWLASWDWVGGIDPNLYDSFAWNYIGVDLWIKPH